MTMINKKELMSYGEFIRAYTANYSFNELGENRQISSICYAHNLVVKGMGRT